MLTEQYCTSHNASSNETNSDQLLNGVACDVKRRQVNMHPTQQQMSKYLKKVYLQTIDSNDHIDKIRKNYLKRKNKLTSDSSKGTSQNLTKASSLQDSSFINESSRTDKSANTYLRKLQEESQKSSLPEEIRNNKLLCSLYQKLDTFENNLKTQHQKQIELTKINKLQLLDSDSKLSEQDRNFRKLIQNSLQTSKIILTQKKQKFQLLKSTLLTSQKMEQFECTEGFSQEYIRELIKETQRNVLKMGSRISQTQQGLNQLKLKQSNHIATQQQTEQIKSEVKQLLCEVERRKNIFI